MKHSKIEKASFLFGEILGFFMGALIVVVPILAIIISSELAEPHIGRAASYIGAAITIMLWVGYLKLFRKKRIEK